MDTLIGHNLPPLDPDGVHDQLKEECRDLIERADELSGGAERCTVTDDESAGKAALLAKLVNEAIKTVTARQRDAKRPYQEMADATFGWFKPVLSKLELAKARTLALLDSYRRKQEAAAALARQQAEEAARKAAEAAKQPDDLDAAEAAYIAQQAAQQAVSAPTPIRSAYGHSATARHSWGYEIENMEAVPRQFLMLNDAAVKAHIKARPRDQAPLPVAGLRFVQQSTTVVR